MCNLACAARTPALLMQQPQVWFVVERLSLSFVHQFEGAELNEYGRESPSCALLSKLWAFQTTDVWLVIIWSCAMLIGDGVAGYESLAEGVSPGRRSDKPMPPPSTPATIPRLT